MDVQLQILSQHSLIREDVDVGYSTIGLLIRLDNIQSHFISLNVCQPKTPTFNFVLAQVMAFRLNMQLIPIPLTSCFESHPP